MICLVINRRVSLHRLSEALFVGKKLKIRTTGEKYKRAEVRNKPPGVVLLEMS